MKNWFEELKYDPNKPLIDSKNKAIFYFIRRDIQNLNVKPIDYLWNLPEAKKIIGRIPQTSPQLYRLKKKLFTIFHIIF